jgi:hypothetical protein
MFYELEYSLLPNLMHILNIRTYPTAPKKKNTMKHRNSERHLGRSCCNRDWCLRRSEICGLVNLRDHGNINRAGGRGPHSPQSPVNS